MICEGERRLKVVEWQQWLEVAVAVAVAVVVVVVVVVGGGRHQWAQWSRVVCSVVTMCGILNGG
jgi:hypothetical protein